MAWAACACGRIDFDPGARDGGGGDGGDGPIELRIAWGKSGGGDDYEHAHGLAVRGGTVAFAGHFNIEARFGTSMLTAVTGGNTTVDGYVATIVDGVPSYAVGLGGPNYDETDWVAIHPSGDLIVHGSMDLSLPVDLDGSGPLTSYGANDVVVARIASSTGTVTWARSFGGPGDDTAHVVAVADDGTIAIGGSFYQSMSSATGPLITGDGALDGFVIQLDDSGNQIDAAAIAGPGDDVIDSLAFVDGDLLAGGTFSQTVPALGLTSAGARDAWIARFDAVAGRVWSRRIGATGDEIGGRIALGRDGPVLAGLFEGTITAAGRTVTASGTHDAFLWALDGDGADRWLVAYGNDASQGFPQHAVDAAGRTWWTTYVAGPAFDLGGGPLPDLGGANDILVAGVDRDGAHAWSRRYGSPTDQTGGGAAIGGDGAVYVSGWFEGTLDVDGITLQPAGGSDAFVLRFDVVQQ
jgi:hypothetical protein